MSNINGVLMLVNIIMLDLYFVWYEGDILFRGNDVNWFIVIELERIVIVSNFKNNIFFDDEMGKFY